MATVRLRIEPDLCGPVSVGTVGVVRVLRERLGLSLSQAETIVESCVFNDEEVLLETKSEEAAQELLAALRATQAGPRMSMVIVG